MINIEFQNNTGVWVTSMRVENLGIEITNAMRQVAAMYPGSRVRAVDEYGRVVDIL